MEEELNPEEFYGKFTNIAAGFVADELPPKIIKPFLDHVNADPYGNKKEKPPLPMKNTLPIKPIEPTASKSSSGKQPLPIQNVEKKRAIPESVNKAVEEATAKAKKSAGVKANKGQEKLSFLPKNQGTLSFTKK